MYKALYFFVLLATAFSYKKQAPTTESPVEEEDIFVKRNNAASRKLVLGEDSGEGEDDIRHPVLVSGPRGPTIVFESSGKCVARHKEGECVPYYMCDADRNNNATTDAHVYLEDISCESFLEVCCLKNNLKSTTSSGQTILQDVFSKNNTDSGQNILEDVFSKNNTVSGQNILEDVVSKNNTDSGQNILEDVFSENNTESGQNILEDVFSKNNTASGYNVLEDIVSKSNTVSGRNVLEDVVSKNNTVSGRNVLEDVVSKNNTVSGRNVLEDVVSKNNTVSGRNVLEDVVSKNNTASGRNVLEDVVSKNNTASGHNVLEDIVSKSNTAIGRNVLEDIVSKSNTDSGRNVLEEEFSKNNTTGHNILEDVVSKNITGSGQNILDIHNGTQQKPVGSRDPTLAPSVLESNVVCMTRGNEVGECVVYHLCAADGDINSQDTQIVDWRDLPCESLLDVCCPKAKRIDLKNMTTATRRRGHVDIIRRKRRQASTVQPSEIVREGCGWRNPDGVGSQTTGITNDEETANFAEFPWIAAILKYETENGTDFTYLGSGSLIHPNVVLTAAHHVNAAQRLRVRLGEWDTQTTKEIYPYQDRDVAKVEIHKDFNRGNLFYDIALLFLATPVDPAPNVGVVCLPPPKQRAAAGTRCFASGWGKDTFGKEGRYQVILKKVDIPVVERKECLSSLRKTRLGSLFELHSSFMCAGGEEGGDTCKADSGAPLVCPIEFEKERYVQNGIVAWGIGCGGDGTPGVYVDVARLRDWIDDKVKGQGYDIFTYSYTI